MIVTCKSRVPRLWILIAVLPWSAAFLKYLVMGGIFIFSLKKFVENPAGLTFIMSLPPMISIFLNPATNFISDRIWTRFGRRKPFIVCSWVSTIVCMALMPIMPNFWCLLATYLLYTASNDIGTPIDTLKQEVVPPKQRGLSTAIGTWIQNFGGLAFGLIAIGRFDDYQYMAGVPFTGEQSIYWSCGAAMSMMILVVMLGIKELDPKSKLRGQRLNLKNFFGGILNRNLWPVYLLITGWAILNAGLGTLGALLYTDQWGFTKQEMGYNTAIGGTLNMFLIALIAIFADRLPRMKAYQVLMSLFLIVNFSFYLYVNHVLYDQRPTLLEVVVFGETLSVIGILMGMIYFPLVYDYVPRNELGTYAAGASLLGKLTGIITLNGVGLFVTGYSMLFLPPGGEMARVVLRDVVPETQVVQTLTSGPNRVAGPNDRLSVDAWYATGAVLDSGRAFEIRLKDKSSNDLKALRDDLDQERSKLMAKEANARSFAEAAQKKGNLKKAEDEFAKANKLKAEQAPKAVKIAEIDAVLEARAQEFKAKVAEALGSQIFTDGDQVLAASMQPALVYEFEVNRRPEKEWVERTVDSLRLIRPDVIDLRTVRNGDAYSLALSVKTAGDGATEALGEALGAALEEVGTKRLRGSLVLPALPLSAQKAEALVMDLRVVEDPLDNHPSPITRALYLVWNQSARASDWVWNLIGEAPRPERRICAVARTLREPGKWEHVDVEATGESDHAIRITALFDKEGPAASVTEKGAMSAAGSPAAQRIAELLANQGPARVAQVSSLYDRAVTAAAQNRITVARPFITAAYAAPKYDYMSGYIWMFMLGLIGLGITMMFARWEKKGRIHKRGREESEAAARAEAIVKAEHERGDNRHVTEYYTPGYRLAKLGMLLLGLGLIGFASTKLVPTLRLGLMGKYADAEAVQVVKEKIGGQEKVLKTDAEIRESEERQDRHYVFWNEYRFHTEDGKEVLFRAPAGSQLKPAHYLMDSDGLPTKVLVWYDPANPKDVTLPREFSTWFLPSVLALFGTLGACVAILFLVRANKPIELPRIEPLEDAAPKTPAAPAPAGKH